MKYPKYALVVALLASSAFGAGSAPSQFDSNALGKLVVSLHGKKFKELSATTKNGVKLDGDKIEEILKQVYAEELIAYNAELKAEAELEAKALSIMNIAGSGPISGKPFADYSSHLARDKYDSIAEYEYKADKALTKEELLDFLKDSTLPTVSDDPSDVASRIFKLAGSGKISAITNTEPRIFDLDDNKFEIIKQVEAALGKPLIEDQLKEFLLNNNFHHLEVADRVKAILANNERNLFATPKQIQAIEFNETKATIVDESLLTVILNATDDILDDMMTSAFIPLDATSVDPSADPFGGPDSAADLLGAAGSATDPLSSTSDPAADISSGVSTAPGGSGAAVNLSSSAADGSNDADIINTDNNDRTKKTNPENSSSAASEYSAKKVETDPLAKGTASQKDTTKSTTPAPPAPDAIKEKAKSILAKVQGDGKLSALTKESFGNLVTDELFAAIKSKEDATAKRITEDELVEVIKALEAAAEQKKKAEQEQKDKEAAKQALIAKIKAALANVKDFSELTTEARKALGLTEKQVEALKKANVTKDTTDAEIEKILNGKADATPNAQTKDAKDLNSSKNEPSKGDKAEVPFYMNAWIMVPSSVILLSAIGGGVFMMTRKTEDTDL